VFLRRSDGEGEAIIFMTYSQPLKKIHRKEMDVDVEPMPPCLVTLIESFTFLEKVSITASRLCSSTWL